MTDTAKLFSDKSDIYAQARPTYPEELFKYIKSICKQDKLAWDCATGNGQAAVGLSHIFEHVVATDISKEQIAHHKALPNVEFSVCPAEQTPFSNDSFDLVNVAQALHWFDFDRFWPEVKRVLKPGGAFITYAYGWSEITPEIDALIESEIKQLVEPYWAVNNRLIMNAYRDIDFPFAPLATPDIPIRLGWNFDHLMNYLHSWSATRRCMDAQGNVFFENARNTLGRAWGAPEKIRDVVMPMVIIAGYPDTA